MFPFKRKRAETTANLPPEPHSVNQIEALGQYEYWLARFQEHLKGCGITQSYDPLSAFPTPNLAEVVQIQTGSKANPHIFLGTGMRSALMYINEAAAGGKPISSCNRILEFGVGYARILRHFSIFNVDLFGCDLTPSVISWCKENLSSMGKFSTTSAAPELPYESGTFDLVFANSVFTHIRNDLTIAWIRELRRIVSPGGVVVTSHYDPNEHLRGFTAVELDMAYRRQGYIEWGSDHVRENNISYSDEQLTKIWSVDFDVVGLRHHRDDQRHLICRA